MAYVVTGYVATGYVEDAATPASGYPSPSDVRSGVVYGADGEYIGTYVGGSPSASDIAAAIFAQAVITPIKADVQTINEFEVIGDGTDGNDWRGVGVLPQ